MALDLLIEESTYHRRLKIAPVYLIDVSIRQLIRPQTAALLFVSVCLLFLALYWRFETLYYMSCKKDQCRRRVLFRSFPCTIPRCTHPNSRHCKIRLNHFYLFVSVLDSCKPCHWWSAKALEASFETSPGRLEQMRQAMMQAAQEAEQERKARCSCSGMKLRKHPELI